MFKDILIGSALYIGIGSINSDKLTVNPIKGESYCGDNIIFLSIYPFKIQGLIPIEPVINRRPVAKIEVRGWIIFRWRGRGEVLPTHLFLTSIGQLTGKDGDI